MYLSDLKMWNFRKFGVTEQNGEILPVHVPFNNKLNVLVGENDAGKTAIVDAIRLVLGTQSREWFYVDESDFHSDGRTPARSFKIECCFKGFTTQEAAHFLEWIDIEEKEEGPSYSLTVTYSARNTSDKIIRELRAGSDPEGASLPLASQDLLRVIYLKPLRDAENELTPGKRSRLAQILKAHPAFHKEVGEEHALERIMSDANERVETHFTEVGDRKAADLLASINGHLSNFFPPGEEHRSNITISGNALHDILQRLSLIYGDKSPGLGSLNLLYMAAELLLLQAGETNGLRLTIIEELEAHLHPQAQLRLIKYLQDNTPGQLILTTHSTTLASCLKLESLIICKAGKAFPMGDKYTKLEKSNYDFLERFLDATKANLFFAKGIILVEGDAENILIPKISECLGRPLHQYGVSIVNVGSTAFLHYAKIFERSDGSSMGVKVAIVTDLDVKPVELQDGKSVDDVENEKEAERATIINRYPGGDVATFVSPNWTLEYEIALTMLGSMLLASIYVAEKISNSSTGSPQIQKIHEAIGNAKLRISRLLAEHNGRERARAKIAKEIYYVDMLKENAPGKKKVSKAITAQVFAGWLEDYYRSAPKKLMQRLRSPALKYICDAICHVTAPIEE
jgi:putative ATP-dependent endonuclease of OLD family